MLRRVDVTISNFKTFSLKIKVFCFDLKMLGVDCCEVNWSGQTRSILENYVNSFTHCAFHCYGLETQPLKYFAEDPCIWSIPKEKNDVIEIRNLVGFETSTKVRPYTATFVLEFGMLPLPGFLISHICGRGPRCIEVGHMEIASIALNNERKKCHKTIDDWVFNQKMSGSNREMRTGTLYYKDCPHIEAPCFKQYPKWTVL